MGEFFSRQLLHRIKMSKTIPEYHPGRSEFVFVNQAGFIPGLIGAPGLPSLVCPSFRRLGIGKDKDLFLPDRYRRGSKQALERFQPE